MDNIADVVSRQGLLERHQKAYYRLSVQVAVSTSLIAIYTLHEYQEFSDWKVMFLMLLAAGQLPHLFSPPAAVKKLGAAFSVAGAIGVVFFDPTLTLSTVVASSAGLLSGGISYLSSKLDDRVSSTQSLVRFAEYHSLYQMDQLLNRLGFTRRTGLGVTFRDSLSKLLTQRQLIYTMKRDGVRRNLQITWSEGFSHPIIKRDAIADALSLLEDQVLQDALEFVAAWNKYAKAVAAMAVTPFRMGELLIGQVPSLLDKYQNPEKYLNTLEHEGRDVVVEALERASELPPRPRVRRPLTREALLLLAHVCKNRKSLLREKSQDSSNWNYLCGQLREFIRDGSGNHDEGPSVIEIVRRIGEHLQVDPFALK